MTSAYDVPPADPQTGIVFTTAERRAVGFIFIDQIYMTGQMLMASLERYRAARQLAEIHVALGKTESARRYDARRRADPRECRAGFRQRRRRIAAGCAPPRASRARPTSGARSTPCILTSCRRPRETGRSNRSSKTWKPGRFLYEGALRHVPLNRDASPTSAWEKTIAPHNRYQNGAFWHTPIGWLIAVLDREHPQRASAVFQDYIAQLRKGDFRQGEPHGAPWECLGWDGKADQNPAFVPSVALPYGVLFDKHCPPQGGSQ